MWKHREPRPEDYDYDEEYLAAVAFYYRELDSREDEYIERRRNEEE